MEASSVVGESVIEVVASVEFGEMFWVSCWRDSLLRIVKVDLERFDLIKDVCRLTEVALASATPTVREEMFPTGGNGGRGPAGRKVLQATSAASSLCLLTT